MEPIPVSPNTIRRAQNLMALLIPRLELGRNAHSIFRPYVEDEDYMLILTDRTLGTGPTIIQYLREVIAQLEKDPPEVEDAMPPTPDEPVPAGRWADPSS